MDEKKVLNATVEHFKKFLEEFKLAGHITADFMAADDGDDHKYIYVKITGDELSDLVGFHGKNMESIQNVVSMMLSREFQVDVRVVLEVNDYREKRQQYLESVAQRAVMDVKSTGQDIELPPMKAFERRVIHMTLKGEEGIATESIGEGMDRRIVIKKI